MLARLRGLKTLAIFSPILLLSLLDALGQVDLTPIFAALGISEPSRAAIISAMSLLALVLRIYTTSPVLSAGAKQDQP